LTSVNLLRRCSETGDSSCAQDADCVVSDICAIGKCECGSCTITAQMYGDLNRDGIVDIEDIFCVLDAFQGERRDCSSMTFADIGLCMPDGRIDLLDILGVLDAFSGQQNCCP